MFFKNIRHAGTIILLPILLLFMSCSSESDEAPTDMQQHLELIEELETRFARIMNENPNSLDFQPTARHLAEEYRIFAERYEQHEEAPEMLFRAANLKADALGEYAVAAHLFHQIQRIWPDTEQGERALFLAGYTYNHMLGRIDRAREVYESFIATYPESELRPAVEDELLYLGIDAEEMLRNLLENEE